MANKDNTMKRSECSSITQKIMEEIKQVKDGVTQLSIDLAKLPGLLADKFDERYAPIEIVNEIKDIKTTQKENITKINDRVYLWLEKIVMVLGGGIISYFLFK